MRGEYKDAIAILKTLGNANNLPYYIVFRRHLLKLKCLFDQSPYGADTLEKIEAEQYSFKKMLDRYKDKGLIAPARKESFINLYKLLCRIAKKASPEELNDFLASRNGYILELKWAKEKIANPKK